MYKRWQGNSGRVQPVEDGLPSAPPPPPPPLREPPREPLPPPPPPGAALPPLFGRLFGALGELEAEDLLLMGMLYFLYRESGDVELLLVLGFLFFL